MDGNNRRCFPDGRKGMQRPEKIEKRVGKNPCQSEKGATTWDRQLCLCQWQWTRKGLWQPQKIQLGRRGAKRSMRLLRARGSATLKKEASGSCYAVPFAGKSIVGPQIVFKDRSLLP